MANPARCAVHPGRPAVDECPVCGRPRCGADAAALAGSGCPGCHRAGAPAGPARARASMVERLVAAALAALAVALLGGVVVSEYVGAAGFAELTPALAGLACGLVAATAARTSGRDRLDLPVRGLAAVYAVLGTMLAFRLVPGGSSPFSPAGQVLPPYAAAVAGAFASRLFR